MIRRLGHALPPATAKVGLFGLFACGNSGNDGSLDAMLGRLRGDFRDDELVIICREPEVASAAHGVPAVSMVSYRGRRRHAKPVSVALRVLSKLVDPIWMYLVVRRLDVVVIPGMGVFEQQVRVRPWGLPYGLFLLGRSCRMSGTRLAAVNVGAEPADHPVTRRFFASAARATSYCSYRDEFSRRSMVTMGVRHEDAPVLPDLVLGVQRSDAAESTPSDIVCVGIMAYYGPRDDKVRGAGLHASYVERVGEFCSWVAGRGYVLRLLVGDVVDEAVGERIRERVLAEHPEVDATRVTVMSCTTLDAVMDDVAGCRIVVAARYHNLVCSLRMARPTIAIGYGGKHDDLLERAGLAGNSEHISAFTVSWLTQRFLDLEGRQQAIVADLVRRNARMRRELDAQYDDLRRGVLGVSPGTSPRPALPLQDVVAHH